ncbi:MAG: glycosyltransferase, partial [Caldilineaceae bacterium]|nr:glycosyltransferase [Caldilineaceae bacterium]
PEAVRSSYQMLFFSRVEQPPAPVQEMVRDGYAQVLIRPGNEDLVALYNQARGFVFPSLYEGLGLPPLEAMKCGAPVIASNRGSVPEVVGDAAIVLDAQDDAALAQAIQRLIEDEGFHAAMQARGFARVEEFSWPKPADRVLDVYRSVLAQAAIGRQADTRVSL